ncbi:hypothetical protein V5799_026687 [Amblyomma americanum]|uniref:Uncharacterized protein n=1 Tax=Amblyomma americanum TaxID=6943 RepID=A0AAQ4DHV6_AMBAM
MNSEDRANVDRDGKRSSMMEIFVPRPQEETPPAPIVLPSLLRSHLQGREDVLCHVIDGYVILESSQPFPVINRELNGDDMFSTTLDASPPSVQDLSAALPAAGDSAADLIPNPETTQEASSGQGPR